MPDLRRYRAKRRFDVTPEPEGRRAEPRRDAPMFVVQKHAARRMHYDLRLEIDGVLKSWAVPEGPCLDPKVRRLAVLVEDHPLDYASFEGRIPSGEYGAGGVIVWDRGTWVTLAEDPLEALAAGEIKIRLAGEKLRGGWTLVRLGKEPKSWLFIKERDDEARPLSEYDVLVEEPLSVLSGVAVEDFAKAEPAPKRAKVARPKPERIPGAKPATLPERVSPQLGSAADAAPEGEAWLHEIKYDGYRTIVRIENGEARLFTRNKLDWTHRYGALARAFRELPCKTAVIDGEVAVQDPRGVTSIALLETALSEGRDHELTFFAFDLIHLDGYDLTASRLLDRKTALAGLLSPLVHARSPIQVSEHFTGAGAELFAHAMRMGLEGVMSKRVDAPYEQKRTRTWLKLKRSYVGEFVVVGFTQTTPGRVAALILAEETADGALAFVGRVASGLTDALAAEQHAALSKRALEKPPVEAPRIANATWTEPAAVARVAFNSRAPDGAPRQPVLVGVSPYTKPAAALKPRIVTDRDLAAIRLTNPERAMFGSDTTKLDIAVYYARVGDWMLPELLRRPLTFLRCTTGERADCFYQRHAFAGLPHGIGTIGLSDEEGRADFIYLDSAQGFLSLTQFGAVELHPWACRIDDPEHPDRFIVDLDPDPALAWPLVRAAAEQLRDRLEALGFHPFVRTTGGKGLHLVMALAPGKTGWRTLKDFAEAFGRSVERDAPQVFTASPAKDRRKGRIYLDWLRNARGATGIASYSLRANESFTVAAPVTWEELRSLPGPQAFDRRSMLARLSRLGADPWEELQSSARDISRKAKLAVGMKT